MPPRLEVVPIVMTMAIEAAISMMEHSSAVEIYDVLDFHAHGGSQIFWPMPMALTTVNVEAKPVVDE
jgi:hypothetical protein